jgi:hypothetical protein
MAGIDVRNTVAVASAARRGPVLVIILQRRSVMVLVGLIVGALAGLAVYQGSRLTGRPLYALAGATAGVVAVVIFTAFRQSARLTTVKVSVPQFTELSFSVTDDRRRTAWSLFVEAATRTSTQPLADGTGSLREAMTSLYGLFVIVRETLKVDLPNKARTPGPTVEYLAIALLNDALRPFLTRWHPMLRQWEREHPDAPEQQWPLNDACRADLAAAQVRVIEYARGFAELAGFDRDRADALLYAGVTLDRTRVPSQPGPPV